MNKLDLENIRAAAEGGFAHPADTLKLLDEIDRQITSLRLEPGDIVLVRYGAHIPTEESMELLREGLRDHLSREHLVVLLPEGTSLHAFGPNVLENILKRHQLAQPVKPDLAT